jgi:drug/metabolite transporter (DMT)-like permease
MEPNALTFLSYGLIGYLIASVIILISVHKEGRGKRPLKVILWFGAAMMALCAVVILYDTSSSYRLNENQSKSKWRGR